MSRYMVDANNIAILEEINKWYYFLKILDLRKDEDIKSYNKAIKEIKKHTLDLKEIK